MRLEEAKSNERFIVMVEVFILIYVSWVAISKQCNVGERGEVREPVRRLV